MAENVSTWRLGDAQVELGGNFLGEGAVSIQIAPHYLAVRRDGMNALRTRRVTEAVICVSVELPGPERLLEVLDGSDSSGFTLSDLAQAPFTSGATLKIYPADPLLRGFSFPMAYLRESADATGKYLKGGALTATFECEANASGVYFTRIAANSRPSGVTTRAFPDLVTLEKNLVTALATPLQASVNGTLSREVPLSVSITHYTLLLRSCKNFEGHAPREIHFELVARGPEADHDTAVVRLAAAANWLYGFRPVITGFAPIAGQIESMEFNKLNSVRGTNYRESRLAFVLYLA